MPSLSKCPSSISSRMLNGVIWMSSSKSIVGSSWPVKTQEEQTFPMAKLKLIIKQHEHVNLMCVHVNCNYNNVKFTGASNSRATVLSLVYMCINRFNERERERNKQRAIFWPTYSDREPLTLDSSWFSHREREREREALTIILEICQRIGLATLQVTECK